MKRFLFLLGLVCSVQAIHAQYTYVIKADSVKITNTCDTAELIIENHTQTVPGFLFNKGRGRTEFRRAMQGINDTLVMIGPDTLRLPNAWMQGGTGLIQPGYSERWMIIISTFIRIAKSVAAGPIPATCLSGTVATSDINYRYGTTEVLC